MKSSVSKPGVHLGKEYEDISLVSYLHDNEKRQDHWMTRSVLSFTRHTRPDCSTHVASAALIELFHCLPVIAYVGNRSGNGTMDRTIHSHCPYSVSITSLYSTTVVCASNNTQCSFLQSKSLVHLPWQRRCRGSLRKNGKRARRPKQIRQTVGSKAPYPT